MTTWILVARAEVGWATDPARPPRSEVLSCPLCGLAVRAYAGTLREPEPREVFACPGCGAFVEPAALEEEMIDPLPGATLEELKAAVHQAMMEAERWRCQADGARQRKDLEWADRAVSWAVEAERRVVALRRQAARSGSSAPPWSTSHRQ